MVATGFWGVFIEDFRGCAPAEVQWFVTSEAPGPSYLVNEHIIEDKINLFLNNNFKFQHYEKAYLLFDGFGNGCRIVSEGRWFFGL